MNKLGWEGVKLMETTGVLSIVKHTKAIELNSAKS